MLSSFPWWSLLLMTVGVLALGTLVLSLFSSIGDRPGRAEESEACAVGTPDFLLAVSGVLNAPLHRGGTARMLNNGDEIFPAMLKAIREAERSINFTVYIWKEGELSDLFFDALAERARAGVGVRILVDGFGGMHAPSGQIDVLRQAGAKWVDFHPPRFGKLTRIHKRNHRRALVVDGRIGFTGGAAIMDRWLGDAQDPEHWRDSMVEVGGRLALSLQSAFAQLWTATTGEFLLGEDFYPLNYNEHQDGEGEAIRRHISVISSPSAEAHPMRALFWFTIKSAQQRVYLTNPYFVPDATLLAVLKERAGAGVDIRLLLPNQHIDLPPIRYASQSYFEELLAAGIRIFEYQPTMIHQKVVVADGIWSLVGSVNMDVRSKELNQENALGILDEDFATQLERIFLADLEKAKEVDLQQWRRRPVYRHVPERFFRLFEEQL